MDYKEKYEQALMVAKETYDKQPMYREWLEKMFPELVESEDEKVEKAIFGMVYDSDNELWSSYGISKSDVLAWLEKQGKKSSIWTDSDRIMAFTLLRDVDQMTYISDEGKNERLQWLNSLEDKFNNGE